MSIFIFLAGFFILIVAARRGPDSRALQRKLVRAFPAVGAGGRVVSAQTVGATEPGMRAALGVLETRGLVEAQGPDAYRVNESDARAALRRDDRIALVFWCALIALPFVMVRLIGR